MQASAISPLTSYRKDFFKKWFRRTLFSPWTRPMKKRYYDYGALWLNLLEDLLSYYKRSFRYICSTCLFVAYAKIVAFINSLTYFKHQFPFIGYLFANMEKTQCSQKKKKNSPSKGILQTCLLVSWNTFLLTLLPGILKTLERWSRMQILWPARCTWRGGIFWS